MKTANAVVVLTPTARPGVWSPSKSITRSQIGLTSGNAKRSGKRILMVEGARVVKVGAKK